MTQTLEHVRIERSSSRHAPVAHARRRIVILNQAFYPDVVATAQQATVLAVSLAEHGYDVTVIAGSRGYDDPSHRYSRRETYRDVRIVRVGSTALGKSARWRRAADFASFMANCAAHAVLLPRTDLVIALTSPPLISWLASLLVPWKAKALLFWVMDLNPDEAIAAGWLRGESFSGRLLNRLQLQSMRRAAGIIVLDRFMKDRLLAKGLPGERIRVIPPWSLESAHFDAGARNEFRARHGLSNKFVVMYSGNHSPCHPLQTLLESADKLQADDYIVFCFVGGGSEHRRIQQLAREKKLPNIVCLPYQPPELLAGSLSAADLHVAVMGDAFVGIVHPCKVYNILRVGTPVLYIGPRQSHIADLAARLDGAGQFYCAAHGDVQAVVDTVQSLARKPRPWSLSHREVGRGYSPEVLLPQMIEAIDSAMDFAR